MSEYTVQAEQFAKKHNVTLTIIDSDYKSHFPDDKKNGVFSFRHVFKLRLARDKKSYTFQFGQSIANGRQDPTMYDVLACLTKYDPDTFEDFCDNYGYDTDSRAAEKIHKSVCKEWKTIERLFSDVLEELQEIQ